MNWNNVPNDIEESLRAYGKMLQSTVEKVDVPRKHKYAFVLGKDNRETKALRKLYNELNNSKPYPRER